MSSYLNLISTSQYLSYPNKYHQINSFKMSKMLSTSFEKCVGESVECQPVSGILSKIKSSFSNIGTINTFTS